MSIVDLWSMILDGIIYEILGPNFLRSPRCSSVHPIDYLSLGSSNATHWCDIGMAMSIYILACHLSLPQHV